MFVLGHPQKNQNVKKETSLYLSNSVVCNNIPMGDMGNLCPSYDFSFSSLLLKILLLRETDTLSIAAPKRTLNCWAGFSLSSCTISTHRESRDPYYEQRKH